MAFILCIAHNPSWPGAGQSSFCKDQIFLSVRCNEGNEEIYPKIKSVWSVPVDYLGMSKTILLTASMFLGVCNEHSPGGFLFITDPLILNALTHQSMVFQYETVPWCPTINILIKNTLNYH